MRPVAQFPPALKSGLRPITLMGMLFLFAASSFGQVPDTVARIVSVNTSQGVPYLEYQNTGSKPIAAVILQYIGSGSNHGSFVWQIHDGSLPPNGMGSLQVWKEVDPAQPTKQVDIAAVIFTDRTHLGSAPTKMMGGTDAVSDIFAKWQGEADAFAAWQTILDKLPTEDHAFIQAFVAKANSVAIPQASSSAYQQGAMTVDAGMKATAKRITGDIARGNHLSIGATDPANGVHDEASAHHFILSWVHSRTVQSQLEAADKGVAQ